MTVPRSPMPSTSLRRIASGTAKPPGRGPGPPRPPPPRRPPPRLALPVAVAVPAAAALAALALRRVAHVRKQRDLTRALDRQGDLVLVATAGAGDPARADLAALGDEPAKRADVLVVDVLDLVLAEQAGLAAAAAGAALLVAPARGLAVALLCH